MSDKSPPPERRTRQSEARGKNLPGNSSPDPGKERSAKAVAQKLASAPSAPLIMIALASLAVYIPSLVNGFVFDDNIQIVTNRWIRDFSHLSKVFSSNVAGFTSDSSTNYYRPLMYVAYMMIFKIVGLDPFLYHAVNLALHMCATLMVFLIARRIPWPISTSSVYLSVPFLAAMLFATHPIHTEAVMWVAALPDVAYAFFFLLSFYLYMLGRKGTSSSSKAYALSLGSYTFALFFKEPAATLPIFLVVYDLASRHPQDRFPLKLYALYAAVTFIYFAARYNALGGIAPQARYADLTTWQMVMNTLPLAGEYLRLLVLPAGLNAFHAFRPLQTITEPRVVISLLALGFLVAAAFHTYKKHRPVFLSLSLTIIPLFPSFYMPALGENPSAERYLYLPSAGFAMIFGFALAYASSRLTKRLVATFAVFLLIAYACSTVARASVWKDELSLWTDTVTKSGDSATAHKYYGYALYTHGRLDEAVQEYNTSLHMNPRDPDTHLNLGVAYSLQGLHNEAIQEYTASLKLKPSALGEVNLGLELMKVGNLDQAMPLCRSALRRDPYSGGAHNCIGAILGYAGMYKEAAREFRAALDLDPGNPTYADNFQKAVEAAYGQGR